MTWRPIETAPKDGTTILLAAPNNPVVAGWFNATFTPFPWVFVDDISEVLCQCEDGPPRLNANGYPLTLPTHWMPLPEPPYGQ